MTSRRIYVASSWRNRHQPYVVNLLRAFHQVYDFRNPPHGDAGFSWRKIDADWENWDSEKYRHLLTTNPVASHGFLSDLRGMQWADTCVLVLPCGRSAHLEAGWFCGAGKRCIVFIPEKVEPELMNLLATEICLTTDELVRALA